ncbi:MAG: hypothetical protein HXM80_03920 [Neisseria sicca]|uniref:Uncharacterized protein n=1 Tax=Neisseria sicca TaxID=490 RepID=A0A930DFU3_NEISI|nr:hypothetical protein [Neisseria sicca]
MPRVSEAINIGNGVVNASNISSNNLVLPNQDNSSREYTSQDWVNAAGATYGYLDNLLQIGGKSLPFANSAAIGSASYNLC